VKIYEDLRVVQARSRRVQVGLSAAFLALLANFWHLQVVRGREFRELAENNRTRTVSLAAPRGPLLDRSGRTLVENQPSFNVVLTPEHSDDLDRSIALLSQVLGISEGQIRERLARRPGRYRPVVLKSGASFDDIAALEARRLEIPEAGIEVVPVRSYPLAAAAAHALGRVGEVTDRQLQMRDYADLEPGALVGQAGLEQQYNRRLMGRDGFRRVIVNSRGIEVAEAERRRPTDGPSLTLTLDAGLQAAMDRAFAGRSGSAIALDPANGEILAMTSVPAYDPNGFATGIELAAWNRLATDPETPLMNRVIQGQYSPGSLFKVVMATAALEEGVITADTRFFCPGHVTLYDTVFHCHRAEGHGWVNVVHALEQSCNVFFYQVGVRLEIEAIARWARRMGLGAATGVDLPHEASGLMPSPEWKLRTQKAPWYAGETVSVAIGQGQVNVTPLQMARLAAVVASGGQLCQPHLVRAVGGVPVSIAPPRDLHIRPATIALVRAGLWSVVNGAGTGWRARLRDVAVCGKTGSAQVVARARLQREGGRAAATMFLPHGWFLAFAPVDAPRIALAVLVEHGGSGSEAAAPVAREILAAFFGSRAETGPTPGAVQATAQAMPVEPSRTARASAATAGRE
jgi:penicillin-binding protein 2